MLPQAASVQKYKQVEDGAVFQIFVPDYEPAQKLSAKCEIRLDDGRTISAEQRKKIFAMCRDISEQTGHENEELRKNILLEEFCSEKDIELFSLSNVDMTTARLYIEFILEFCYKEDFKLSGETRSLAKEVNNYLYVCLLYRKCACCGERSDIHHVDAVGMGRDRTKVDHTKHRLIALCRKHHDEAHNSGWSAFKAKYHLEGIKVNEETVKKLGL